MSIENKLKEITELIDNIKVHSDRLKDQDSLPLLELSAIISKITQLHENALILKYLAAVKQHYELEEFGVESPVSRHQSETIEDSDEVKEESEIEGSVLLEESNNKEDANAAIDAMVEKTIDSLPAESKKEVVPEKKPIVEQRVKGVTEEPPIPAKEESALVSEIEPEKVSVPEFKVEHTPEIKDIFPSPELKKEVLAEARNNEEKKPEVAQKEVKQPDEEEPAITIREIESKVEIESRPDLNEAFSGSKDDSLSGQLRKQPIKDLVSAIGLNERYLYANDLFNGEMTDFKQAIQQLNEFENGSEAKAFFNNSLKNRYGWEEDNDLAKALYLLVERRYI